MSGMRRKYDLVFKQEAVRLLVDSGLSARQVEQDLGIGQSSVAQWKRELDAQARGATPGPTGAAPSAEALRHLQRDLARVTRERDLLKKAVAICSEDRS